MRQFVESPRRILEFVEKKLRKTNAQFQFSQPDGVIELPFQQGADSGVASCRPVESLKFAGSFL